MVKFIFSYTSLSSLIINTTFVCSTLLADLKEDDPYLWLEEISSPEVLKWVNDRNAESGANIDTSPDFKTLELRLLEIMDSKEKIPYVILHGDYYYNLWQDDQNPRGLWRRTTWAEYEKSNPKWDVVLDIDALNAIENTTWTFQGAKFLDPGNKLALVSLSCGGSDACVVREFNLETKEFVQDGFSLPESKTCISWIDHDTVFVGTNFGLGSMTTSGYPRQVKVWKRGTPLNQAELVFEGNTDDIGVIGEHDFTKNYERDFILRKPSRFTKELYIFDKNRKLKQLDVQNDAQTLVFREWLLIEPRSEWTVGDKTYSAGSLLAAKFDDYMAGDRTLTILFEPTDTQSLYDYFWTCHYLVLNVLDNVKNHLYLMRPRPDQWTFEPIFTGSEHATIESYPNDPQHDDKFFTIVCDFLTPTTLNCATVGEPGIKVKQMPESFDTSGMVISQHFAVSKDGTRIPYFQVTPKGFEFNRKTPTIIYGYGGFENSQLPSYSPLLGEAWLKKGGVYVVANIRGGGEYGPKWHQAALKQNRMRAYEDFAAVAEDLVDRKVTSVEHLGAIGGSNGGLLMGNMITLYPNHFGAIVCEVPLLDMKRYSCLLAGASWKDEYGDPDKPEEWSFIKTFSPYHNLKKGIKYPAVLFVTSTRDDRVHPGHARKMMAKMQLIGADVSYYENIEGGHGEASTNEQAAYMEAKIYTFLWDRLK